MPCLSLCDNQVQKHKTLSDFINIRKSFSSTNKEEDVLFSLYVIRDDTIMFQTTRKGNKLFRKINTHRKVWPRQTFQIKKIEIEIWRIENISIEVQSFFNILNYYFNFEKDHFLMKIKFLMWNFWISLLFITRVVIYRLK